MADENPTRVLIVGATGGTGRQLVAQALERGHVVTALVRDPSALRVESYTFFVIPFILPFYFWDKTRQERLIAASRVNWVIVRPGALTNGAKRNRYKHGRRVGSVLTTVRISRADVTDFMLNQMTDNSYSRSAPGLCE